MGGLVWALIRTRQQDALTEAIHMEGNSLWGDFDGEQWTRIHHYGGALTL